MTKLANMANVANSMMMLKHGTRVTLFWIPTCRLAGDAVQALNRDPRLTSELDFSKTRLNNLDMTAHFSHYTEMSIITFKGTSPTFLLKVTISGACKSPKSWMKEKFPQIPPLAAQTIRGTTFCLLGRLQFEPRLEYWNKFVRKGVISFLVVQSPKNIERL